MPPTKGPTPARRPTGRPRKEKEPYDVIAFRFPPHLVDRLDRYCKRIKKAEPARGSSRSEVVRMALEKELAQHGLPPPGTRRRHKTVAAAGNGQGGTAEKHTRD